jgi:hypothetical protein
MKVFQITDDCTKSVSRRKYESNEWVLKPVLRLIFHKKVSAA